MDPQIRTMHDIYTWLEEEEGFTLAPDHTDEVPVLEKGKDRIVVNYDDQCLHVTHFGIQRDDATDPGKMHTVDVPVPTCMTQSFLREVVSFLLAT